MYKRWIKRKLAMLLSLLLVCSMFPATAFAAEIAPLEDENFTLLWTTDPQWYSFAYPEIIQHQNQWVVDNYDRLDVRYIFHTGDFVDDPHSQEQWSVMTEQYALWDDAGLAYGILAGNHDVDGSDHTEFSQYFGKARYENNAWYGGDYDDNFGHYDLMTIEGVEFVFVYLGYNSSYTQEDYDWLNSVLSQYSNRIAVLSFHEYLAASGERTANGENFFQNVVLKNPNVRMVFCGHNYNSTRKVDEVDDNGDGVADRTVFQIMANYQSTTKGGNGFMRFMECDVADGVIVSRTYSPYIETYGSDYEDGTVLDEYGYRDEFTIPFDFSVPAAKDADDPETGTVVVTSKLTFALTQEGDAAITLPLTYQNQAEIGNVYDGVGVYDRFFSLDATDAFATPSALNYVTAEYVAGDGYYVTDVVKGSSLTANDWVVVPQNGVVITLPQGLRDEDGAVVDMDRITVGRKIIFSKAYGITTPSAVKNMNLTADWGEAYSIVGTNRLTGNDDWILYDDLLGGNTSESGYTHEWEMLFAFTPVAEASGTYTLTEANTVLGEAKSMDIPQNGFVLSVNTYSGEEALRTSLKERFAEGLRVTLNGYTPGEEAVYNSQSILPDTVSGWTYDSSLIQVAEQDEGYVIYKTDGQWPTADYVLSQPITFDPANMALAYDFTLETSSKSNIILFFNTASPSNPVGGQYLSVQSYFSDVTISSGSGDIKGDDLAHTGKIDLSTVTFPDDCYNSDGTLTLNAVRVFASGEVDKKMYFRHLSLTNDQRDTVDTGVSQTIPLMDPTVLSVPKGTPSGGYCYDNGKLTVTANTDAGYELVFDLNKAFDVSLLQNWLIDVTSTTLFDIQLIVTTAGADASYGFVSDFYPTLCGALENGYISAGTYAKALNLYSCYTWNNVLPADGISTVKQVKILLAGVGTLTVDVLQVSNTTAAGVFADGVYVTGGTLAGIVFDTDTYSVSDTIVSDVAAQTTVEAFLAAVTSDYTVTVSENRVALDGAATVKTGQVVTVTSADVVLASYAIAVYGDVNGDGMMSSTDARVLLTVLLGVSEEPSALCLAAGDINRDGTVTTVDVRRILQSVVM